MGSNSQSCEAPEEVSGRWGSPSEGQGRAQSLTLVEEDKESIKFPEWHNHKEGGKYRGGMRQGGGVLGDRGIES